MDVGVFVIHTPFGLPLVLSVSLVEEFTFQQNLKSTD
jgi:hypothetical protein